MYALVLTLDAATPRRYRSPLPFCVGVSDDMAAALTDATSPAEPSPLRIAIDIGVKNISLCALRFPSSCSPLRASPPQLPHAKARLQSATCEAWEVVSLGVAPKDMFAARATAVAAFVQARLPLFEQAETIIVEHQLHSTMRCIASSLFSCLHLTTPRARLVSQHSKVKLSWCDRLAIVTDAVPALLTYTARKRAGIQCAAFLLDLSSGDLKRSRARAASLPLAQSGKMQITRPCFYPRAHLVISQRPSRHSLS